MNSGSDEITTTVKTDDGFIEVISGSVSVLSEDEKPTRAPIPIGPEPCVVGRGGHCHVSVADRHMSTSHFQLVATPEGICVTDEGSLNGTWVNGARLKPNNSLYLVANARLRCGHTWFNVLVTGREQVPISGASAFGPLVGRSVGMREMYAKIAKFGPTELSVLITGETGTGKELVAQAIHDCSLRRSKPFVPIDCASIPPTLAESKLFGHEKGAFTGAVSRVRSPFIEAQGGTIFFDELGELPEDIQVKLLRALETRQIQAVGSTRYEPIDVRVIAATRRNLHVEMNSKRFRDDLYYRFAQTVIETPPLRKRPEDIPDLVANLLSRDAKGDPGAFSRIDQIAMERLKRHDWPGNVRELRNVVAVAVALSGGGPIDFVEALSPRSAPHFSEHAASQTFEELQSVFAREYFTRLDAESEGNVSAMARKSGLSRTRVREYLQQFGLRSAKVDK